MTGQAFQKMPVGHAPDGNGRVISSGKEKIAAIVICKLERVDGSVMVQKRADFNAPSDIVYANDFIGGARDERGPS